MRPARLKAALLVLSLLALPSLTAQAAPASRPRAAASSVHELPREVTRAVIKFIRSIAGKSGCAVDPLGRCIPGTSTTATPAPVCPSSNPEEYLDLR